MNIWEERFETSTSGASEARTAYDVDYGRVIHSAAFRRLQGKTQILNLGDSDFYRTRLTHSLEVSQLGVGLMKRARTEFPDLEIHLPTTTLMQTICSVHDLGHPPYGHGGEVALNYCMRNSGGFEGNGQSLRILSKLEHFSKDAGANLTRRSLLGILKYPAPYSRVANKDIMPSKGDSSGSLHLLDRNSCKPPKCYLDTEKQVVDWVLSVFSDEELARFTSVAPGKEGEHGKPRYKSLDCSIMELADDISNAVHDLEDAISLKFVDSEDFRAFFTVDRCRNYIEYQQRERPKYFGSNNAYDNFISGMFARDASRRKMNISMLVTYFLDHLVMHEVEGFSNPMLKYNLDLAPAARQLMLDFKAFVYDKLIQKPSVQHLEFKGQQMVVDVFEIIAHEPRRFLPSEAYGKYVEHGESLREICDHVAGMTDNYLMQMYERLLSPRVGSVFDHL
ncbi:dGTPase [Kordiimonas sp. SCSIO 12603]|uniref:anti-phage deoxyguanosine triphosphatase n=1 Tax=Kordiimonas sp. SCSIO 12603 TaxID=2829596 RepID=UPI002108311C|nr:anti-phage deoxyguanosine triphosphatase [Kordiimonas sp. SCSIO 12603]UTW59914.1 dGTPase [Kordiimonas sp. SCSIO 12603]